MNKVIETIGRMKIGDLILSETEAYIGGGIGGTDRVVGFFVCVEDDVLYLFPSQKDSTSVTVLKEDDSEIEGVVRLFIKIKDINSIKILRKLDPTEDSLADLVNEFN